MCDDSTQITTYCTSQSMTYNESTCGETIHQSPKSSQLSLWVLDNLQHTLPTSKSPITNQSSQSILSWFQWKVTNNLTSPDHLHQWPLTVLIQNTKNTKITWICSGCSKCYQCHLRVLLRTTHTWKIKLHQVIIFHKDSLALLIWREIMDHGLL